LLAKLNFLVNRAAEFFVRAVSWSIFNGIFSPFGWISGEEGNLFSG